MKTKKKKPVDFWKSGGPIMLREVLLANAVPQTALAKLIVNPKTGKPISYSYLNGVCNRGNSPKGWASENDFRADVEAALDQLGLPKAGIWDPVEADLPAGRQPYQGRRHHYLDQYQQGVEKVNVVKPFLTVEALEHFGLREDPFLELVDLESIWLTPELENIAGAIIGAVQRRSLLAIYGDVGSGKSSLLRYTCGRLLEDNQVRLIWPDCLNRKELDSDALVHAVLRGMNHKAPYRREARKAAARDALEEAVKTGEKVALIIDESHDLPVDIFVGLKRLWDSGMLFKLLAVIVVGQGGKNDNGYYWGLPGLILGSPRLREFAERALMIGMPKAKAKDLADYLTWRFARAGGDLARTFEPSAINALARRTDCLQKANNTAARAMLAAWKVGENKVTAEAVASV